MNKPQQRILLTLGFAIAYCGAAVGQQLLLETPFQSNSSSFNENFGVNFGFSLGGGNPNGTGSRIVGLSPSGQLGQNIGFNQNFNVVPSFGGFDPNSSARFGFSRRSPNGSGFSLGLNLASGSTRNSSTITPSIVIPNGGVGFIGNGSISPFVTGVTPVVGLDNGVTRGIASGQLRPYDPVAKERERSQARESRSSSSGSARFADSSASYGDLSVAEIKAQRQREQASRTQEFELAVQTAKAAARKEDYRTARINLRKAIKLTDDEAEKQKFKGWMKKITGR